MTTKRDYDTMNSDDKDSQGSSESSNTSLASPNPPKKKRRIDENQKNNHKNNNNTNHNLHAQKSNHKYTFKKRVRSPKESQIQNNKKYNLNLIHSFKIKQ